jgi:hypothetical protein
MTALQHPLLLRYPNDSQNFTVGQDDSNVRLRNILYPSGRSHAQHSAVIDSLHGLALLAELFSWAKYIRTGSFNIRPGSDVGSRRI